MPNAIMFHEKRTLPRVSLSIPVTYRVIEDPMEIEKVFNRRKFQETNMALNVSVGGLYLVGEEPFHLGSVLRLDISLPEISRTIVTFAEVVWANSAGAGLQFETMKVSDARMLKDYLSQSAPKLTS
jgi:hypothetical protein